MYTDLHRLQDFCALSGLCICIRISSSKRLVGMNTSFARKAAVAYVEGLCYLSGLCIRICLLCVKQLVRTFMACVI